MNNYLVQELADANSLGSVLWETRIQATSLDGVAAFLAPWIGLSYGVKCLPKRDGLNSLLMNNFLVTESKGTNPELLSI